MAPLTFSFDWSQFISVVGPIGARIGVDLSADIRLAFGYDTYGLREFVQDDYKKPMDLIDGLYVDDYYNGTSDVPELKLHGGLSASAELNLGIASGGVGGEVAIDVLFDLNDPNRDGKVRLSEMEENVTNEYKFGNALKSPLAVFDIHGEIYAEFYAYLNTFWHDYRWQITDPITIAQFDIDFTRAPKMAQTTNDGLLINIGDYSSGRLNGNTSDGNDEVTLDIEEDTVTISSSTYKAKNQVYKMPDGAGAGGKILIHSGSGKDKITVKGHGQANIEIDAGSGDDRIDLHDYTAESGLIVIKGGDGNDVIEGAKLIGGSSAYLFGDDGRLLYGPNQTVIGAESTMNSDGDGDDTIIGGDGNDVIFGGGGSDKIDGRSGVDVLLGDDGRVLLNEDKLNEDKKYVVSRTQLHDGGGNDTIVGGDGDDLIYGGSGNDWIDGGAGKDLISGEKGDDKILGGSGNDVIDGGDGMDVIFGDRIANGALDIAKVFPDAKTTIKADDFVVKSDDATLPSRDDSGVMGDDTIIGGQGSDIIFGDDGAADSAAGGKDTIQGGLDNDLISGDGGDDSLYGEGGNDVLYGGAGADVIDGGAGDDIVFGGGGFRGLAKLPVSAEAKADPNLYGSNTAQSFLNPNAIIEKNDGDDVIQAGQGSDFIDGQGGNDTVVVTLNGGNAKATTNVADSGETTQDKLVVMGTMAADTLLLRASSTGLGSVDLLPDLDPKSVPNSSLGQAKTNLERVNFWKGGVDNLVVNAGMGDDTIAIDGTAAVTSVDAGSGNDTVLIGQIFKSPRDANSKLSSDDQFVTTDTTQGFLSQGPSDTTTIHGGAGDDKFVALNNSAVVSLYGDDGDDAFATQGFLLADGVTSVVHAPLNIDGGAGNDAFSVGGTEGNDTFFVTKQGILSSGGSASVSAIENQSIIAGAGDDTFNVIGTNAGTVTHLEGGLGNDTVNNGGLAVGTSIPGSTMKGYASAIVAQVEGAAGTAFANALPVELAVNVVDAAYAPKVLFVAANDAGQIVEPALAITEGGAAVTYAMRLSKAPADGEIISVTVTGPEVSSADAARGAKGLSLGGGVPGAALTLKFDATNWDKPQVVTVAADNDDFVEGNRQVYLNTSVVSSKGNSSSQVRSLAVQVTETTAMPSSGLFAGNDHSWTDSIELAGMNSVALRYAIAAKPGATLKVSLNGVELPPKGSKTGGDIQYILDGNTIAFWSIFNARLVGQSGTLSIADYVMLQPSSATFVDQTAHADLGAIPTVVLAPVSVLANGSEVHTSLNVAEGGAINDAFTVRLSQDLPMGQSLTVRLSPKAFGDHVARANLVLSCAAASVDSATGDLLLVFDADHSAYVVTLGAQDDSQPNDDKLVYVPAQAQTLAGIDGAVYAEGNGESKGIQLGDPVMLAYKANDSTNDSNETNEYADKLGASVSDAVTLEFAPSTLVNVALDQLADGYAVQAFGADGSVQLREITGAATTVDGKIVLTLAKPLDGDVSKVNAFRLVKKIKSLFVDERASVDRLFINDKQNGADGASALTRLATVASLSGVAEDLATRTDAMRFTQTTAGGAARIAAEGINYGDFELAEIDLGHGRDGVAVNGANSRTDGFRTVTVLNTGDETGADGDNVTVSSYHAESLVDIVPNGIIADVRHDASAAIPDSFIASGDLTAIELTGFVVEVEGTDGLLQRRTILGANYDAQANRTTILIDRAFSDAVGKAFAVRADLRAGGYGAAAAIHFAADVTTYTVSLPATSNAVPAVGDVFELVAKDAEGKTALVRRIVTAVSGNALTLSGAFDNQTLETASQYRIWKHTDGLLAINAQGGNDIVDASSKDVTGSLIVFGGLGDDKIDVGGSAYVFGDRGQVKYQNAAGDAVTLLGSTEDGSDYTTAATLNGSQTDGVRRAPVAFRSMTDDQGGADDIHVHGDKNVVFGGNGEDTIKIDGSDNVALGDSGAITYKTSDVGTWGDRQISIIQRVETQADNLGGHDVISTGNGANVVFGGASYDTLTTGAGSDVVVGDGGFVQFDDRGGKTLVSNSGQAYGDVDTIDAGIGENTVLGGLGGDIITTGVNRQNVSSDQRDAWSNDKDVVLGDNGSRSFQGTGEEVDDHVNATLSFNFLGGASQGVASGLQAGAENFRATNWNNVASMGPGTYGNDPSEVVTTNYGQRLDGLDLSWGGKEGSRTPSIECNGYTMQNYDPTKVKDASGALQLGDGQLFAGGVRTTAPNSQDSNKLEVEMSGLSKYFQSYSVVVYLDASSEVSSLIQNPQDSTLAKQLGKSTGESIRKVAIDSTSKQDSFYLDDAADANNLTYNTFNGAYVKAFAKDAASTYGKYANYVVFDGLSDDRFVVTITDGVPNIRFNGRDLPSIAGIQIIGKFWAVDTIKSSTGEGGGNDVISTGGGNDIVIGGAGADTIASFGDVRYGVNDADTVIGDNGIVTEMVRTQGLAIGTSVVNAHSIGFDALANLAGASFDDTIVTGNGDDVVIGGDGQDRINTERQDDLESGAASALGASSIPEALETTNLAVLSNQETNGLKVLGLNFSYSYRDSSKDDAQLNIAQTQ